MLCTLRESLRPEQKLFTQPTRRIIRDENTITGEQTVADTKEKTHPDIERMFAEHTYRRQFDQRLPFPEDIFRLAAHDSLIKTYIDAWRSGHCSWESTLISIIVARQQQYEMLFQNAITTMMHSPRSILLGFGLPSIADEKAQGKEEALKYLDDNKLTVLAKHGRTFIIEHTKAIKCVRWHDYIIVDITHEQLADLIKEGLAPIK